MHRDLFGDVASRTPAVRARRSPMLLFSLLAHALVLIAVLAASAIVPEVLPAPREVLAFYEPFKLVDIELPPEPVRRTAPAAEPVVASVSPAAAPVVAPQGVTRETGLENIVVPRGDVVDGLPVGLGAAITGVAAAPPPLPAIDPAPRVPVPLHSGITAPLKVAHVAPIYPSLAREARIEGTVILEAVIDERGGVTSARILRGHPALDGAALDAVRQWTFTPARLNGEPIPVVMTVTVRFQLR